MAIPAEHRAYLQKTDYSPRSRVEFSKEEADLLRRYGHWMEALAGGAIAAATPEQAHFLDVARGVAEPRTPFERVWRKLGAQRADPPPGQDGCAKLEELAAVRRFADDLAARKEAERAAVLQSVQAELDAIEQKYVEPLAEANQAVAELEAEVRAEIVQAGKSARAGGVQAIFYRGSVTWDSKGLAEYAQTNPAIVQFQKTGAPRVVIKYR